MRSVCRLVYLAMLGCIVSGVMAAQAPSFGSVAVGQSSTPVSLTLSGLSFTATNFFMTNSSEFPGLSFVPMTSVYSVARSNNGDAVVVGASTLPLFAQMRQLPLPSTPNEQFCGLVQLAPNQYYRAYVPTAAERAGDFSNFQGTIRDPFTGIPFDPSSWTPFAGNIIPTSLLGGIVAWRVSNSTPNITGNLTCMASFTPQYPGLRQGALIATDGAGHSASELVYGEGVGAQVSFTPGVISTLNTGGATSSYQGVATDQTGYLYIVDLGLCVIKKQDPQTGATTTVAGTGTCDTSPNGNGTGDGGPATSAQLAKPKGIAVDAAGNIYIADNQIVRKVDQTTGIITRIAGNGNSGADSGDGGPAINATLSNPEGLAVDLNGNLYIAEAHTDPANFLYGGEVRKVDATSQVITRLAGTGVNGFSGAGALAVNAQLGAAFGITVDATGNVYIADPNDVVVWKVNQNSGIITVFAGIGNVYGNSGDGGPATSAQLRGPMGLALDPSGNLYIADPNNENIRAVSASTGIITTVAGNGSTSYVGDGSLATQTGIGNVPYGPGGVAVNAAGDLYLCSTTRVANEIFKVSQAATSLTFPPTPPGTTSAAKTFALWNSGNDSLFVTPPFVLGGTNAADFAAQTTCGTIITPGETCTTSITFSPASATTENATLTITDTAANSPQTVTLNSAERMKVFIDSPIAQSSPFLGLATFSGWAIDNDRPIASIDVRVDGTSEGAATYGESRADVCAVYPNQVGCPDIGWTFTLDTTRLSNGTHTLTITANSATGQEASASSNFTVANWSDATVDPIHISIDRPNSSSNSFSGSAAFAGWAIDDVAAISNVSIAVDGTQLGNASYGAARPDVCAAFANRAGCPNVGWNFSLDTTLLADGPHTLTVTATSSAGSHTTVSASFTVANMTPQNPIHISIDSPNSKSGGFSGSAAFAGWAVDDSAAIRGVTLSVDGVSFGSGVYGGTRPDVCGAFPGRSGCPNVGWNFLLDTTLLPNGTHSLEVTAIAADGSHATSATSFTVANPAAGNSTRIFADQPSGSSSILLGVAPLSGWAINDNAAITNVKIFVDGTSYGAANYGSVYRPDVCNIYSGRQGCPYVGWTFLLDTTLLANGTHTLTVSANAADGEHSAVSTSFTVANWTTSGNPFHIGVDTPNAQSAPLTGASATLGGWAVDDAASIAGVTISVDGLAVGNAIYGGSRTDVCNVFANRLGCPNVGWNFALDTTVLADGSHTLDVTATSSTGQSYTATGSFSVANLTSGPIRASIDRPSSRSAALTGIAAFGGWAISDTAAIANVMLSVDGVLAGPATYGGTRSDVCAAFPNRSGCPSVGWNYVLDTTQYANGSHTLDVTVTTTDGLRATESASFAVSN